MPSRLIEEVALRIESLLDTQQTSRLPSIKDLALRFGVSITTISHAIRILADKGRVKCFKGKGIMRAGNPGSGAGLSGDDTSAAKLMRHVRDDIVNGIHHSGDPLPKFDSFIATYSIARDTVSSALKGLARERLIHKKGRRWIVGPGPLPGDPAGRPPKAAVSPVALLIMRNERDLQDMLQNLYLFPFVNQFTSELIKHGVRLVMAQREKPGNDDYSIPWGIAGARECLHRFGGRYRGALIIDQFLTPELFASWVGETSCFGEKAVAFFDALDSGPVFARSSLPARNRGYFRLYFDEAGAIELSLRHLLAHGHRTIGMPGLGKRSAEWMRQRIDRARSIAASLKPQPRLITMDHNEPFWNLASEAPEIERVHRFGRRLSDYLLSHHENARGVSGISGQRDALMALAPSMASLLKEGITALVSCNDWLSFEHYIWLRRAGIEVPRHLSLLSFDNNPYGSFFPISTIDFGFQRLGHMAAHLLIGDIPIRSDRDGAIAGISSVVDRGSVAHCRDAKFRVSTMGNNAAPQWATPHD